MMERWTRWGVRWPGVGRLICDPYSGLPILFRTRREARAWARREEDALHGWEVPEAVKVQVTVGGGDG